MNSETTSSEKPISSFRGEYYFLSNYYSKLTNKILLDGELYPTVEHSYQAAKTDNPDERRKIRFLL